VKLVVADASAIGELLLVTPRAAAARAIFERGDVDLHVPALCDVEVASLLRRALIERRLDAARAAEALDDSAALPLSRHGHLALLGRALELRANFSAYDAMYVALAERLGAALATGDASLARAVGRHSGVEVCAIS
jgi:predicted nucleic acid-binding protein